MGVGIGNADRKEWMQSVQEGLKDLLSYKGKLYLDGNNVYTTGDPIKDLEILGYRYYIPSAVDFVAWKVQKLQSVVGKNRVDIHGAMLFGIENYQKILNAADGDIAINILPEYSETYPKLFQDSDGELRTVGDFKIAIKQKLSENR